MMVIGRMVTASRELKPKSAPLVWHIRPSGLADSLTARTLTIFLRQSLVRLVHQPATPLYSHYAVEPTPRGFELFTEWID